MGRSSGPGIPLWFRCSQCRKTGPGHRGAWDRVELTGRMRKRQMTGGGLRTTPHAREYRCLDCGHVGWSGHRDLAGRGVKRAPGAEKERDDENTER